MKKSKSKSKSLTKKITKSKNQSNSKKNKTTRNAGCFDWLCQYENRYLPSSSPITRRNRNVLTLGMNPSTIKHLTTPERASIVARTVRNTLNRVKGRGSPSEAHKNLFSLTKQYKKIMKEFELNRKTGRGEQSFESPGRSSKELAIETRNMEQRKIQGRERRRREASEKRRNRELISATEKGFSDDGN